MTEYENPLSRGPSSAQRAETVRYFKHALRAQVRDNYLMFIYEKPGKSDARYDTLAVCRTSRDTSASINHSCKTCRKNFYTFIQARRNDNFYAHSGLCVSPKERERHSELSSSRKIKKIADSPYNDLALESSEKFHVAAKRPSRRGGGGGVSRAFARYPNFGHAKRSCAKSPIKLRNKVLLRELIRQRDDR